MASISNAYWLSIYLVFYEEIKLYQVCPSHKIRNYSKVSSGFNIYGYIKLILKVLKYILSV